MTERWFPTDEQLEAWLDQWGWNDEPPGPGDPVMDQFMAAERDTMGLFEQAALKGLDEGMVDKIAVREMCDDVTTRGMLRIMCAVEFNGITALCGHVNEIVPMIVHCNPPLVHCQRPECLELAYPMIVETAPRWPGTCDHCGRPAELLTDMGFTLGHYTILSAICDRCIAYLNPTNSH